VAAVSVRQKLINTRKNRGCDISMGWLWFVVHTLVAGLLCSIWLLMVVMAPQLLGTLY